MRVLVTLLVTGLVAAALAITYHAGSVEQRQWVAIYLSAGVFFASSTLWSMSRQKIMPRDAWEGIGTTIAIAHSLIVWPLVLGEFLWAFGVYVRRHGLNPPEGY